MKRIPPRYQRFAAGGFLVAVVLAFVGSGALPEPGGRGTSRPSQRREISKHEPGKHVGDTGTTDPSRALARALSLEDGEERVALLRELLTGWAARDAEAALEWVSLLEDHAARRSARSRVCLAVAAEDPRRALELALAHGADEEGGGGLLECLAMQWCGKEPATAIEWAQGQPQGEWRERLLAGISSVLSRTDPITAAQVVSGLEPGDLQDEAVIAVVHQWALKDPAAALEWAEAFSEPALRDRALMEIANLRKLTAAAEGNE